MDTNQKEKTVDDEIARVLIRMEKLPLGTEEYLTAVKSLDVLYQTKSHDKQMTFKGISIDTIIAAGTNILGILLVLNYEKFNVITTKAFTMISKGRSV